MAHHHAIDVPFEDDLSVAVEKKLARVRSKSQHRQSHRDLPMLHKLASYESMDSTLFQPRYYSYGPYHMLKVQHNNEDKWLCLAKLLDEFSVSGQGVRSIAEGGREVQPEGAKLAPVLAKCIQKLQTLEKKARHCYEGVTLSSNEFIEMLLLDSCSILFYLMPMKDDKSPEVQNLKNLLFSDMLLIENQIPFFIIEEVWGCFTEAGLPLEVCKETNLIKLFEHTPFQGNNSSTDKAVEGKRIDHLIHLYYLWNVSKIEPPQPHTQVRGRTLTSPMPSATELYEAGIKFRPKTHYSDILDVSFENGVLEMPTLVINPEMMSLLANLVVFEVHSTGTFAEQRRVVSYVVLMDSLVNTKKDVALLQKCGVINNRLQSDQDFASFINGLGERFLNVPRNFFTPMMDRMRDYYDSSCRRNWTSLMHNYFNSPWTGIKVFAGTTLLILAFLQTYFTIFQIKK